MVIFPLLACGSTLPKGEWVSCFLWYFGTMVPDVPTGPKGEWVELEVRGRDSFDERNSNEAVLE